MTNAWRGTLIALGLGLALTIPATAGARTLRVVPDLTVDLSGTPFEHDEVAEENLVLPGAVTTVAPALPALPPGVAISAYIANLAGFPLFSFDTAVELPGGVIANTSDVVLWNGGNAQLVFDASTQGVPEGAVVDAMTFGDLGLLTISFDTTVDLGGGLIADDEDLVEFTGSGFAIVLDGSSEGIPVALDVDAVHSVAAGEWLLSFDGSGTLGGIDFDDEDALALDTGSGTWSLAYDGSARHAGWDGADLNAIAVPEPGWAIGLACGVAALGALARRRSSLSRRDLPHSLHSL